MKKELNTKARIAAFGGGSASDTPKADSRAPMAPPHLTGGVTGGVQKSKTPVHFKKPLNVTKHTSWTVKATS